MIVRVLGVPMDLGSGRRGVDMGPSAIRIAGLADRLRELGHTVVDEGDIVIKNMEALKVGDARARYLGEISRALEVVARKVERIAARGDFPLILGGDHSIAAGSVAGIASFARKKREEGRRALDRCARRHQHPRDLSLRQRPRNARRGPPGLRPAASSPAWAGPVPRSRPRTCRSWGYEVSTRERRACSGRPVCKCKQCQTLTGMVSTAS